MILDIDIYPTHYANGTYAKIVLRKDGKIYGSVSLTEELSKKEFAKIEKKVIQMISKIQKPKRWT